MVSRQATVWVNGDLLPVARPHISIRDRGFTLGDGVFETVRVRGERPLNWNRHLARLRSGAAMLDLTLPLEDAGLTSAVFETLRANGLTEAVLRVSVSRGVARQRGLIPDPGAKPVLVIDAQPYSAYPIALYARGMAAITSSIRRNEHSPLSRAKTLSYLDSVLARREAALQEEDEALLLNCAGELACASAANLFLVVAGALVTPDVGSGALPGTVRGLILEDLAPRLGLAFEERPVEPAKLRRATESFLTSSLLGVMPLTQVDGQPVGAGRPGPVTVRLGAAVEAALEETGSLVPSATQPQ